MTNYIGLEVPVGTVMPCVDFNFTNLGNAWLVCNGQLIDTSTYQDLYNVIGSTYNVGGESSGYFRVPNCQDVIPKCEVSSIGYSAGESNHTLSTAEMPTHYHPFAQGNHYHYFSNIHGDDFNDIGGTTSDFYHKTVALRWNDGASVPWRLYTGNGVSPHTGYSGTATMTSGSSGSGTSFNIIPASAKVLYIIKT